MSAPRLTLGDVLGQEDLQLRLVTVDTSTLSRTVIGAHAIEIPEPARFLDKGWIMLTTGVRLRARPNEQRKLIADLASAGVCALGFGTGVSFSRVPTALIGEADERGFPVFEVPFETPARNIVSFVNHALLSEDMRLLHRSLAMQGHLMEGLRDANPEESILRRLSSLLRGGILLFSSTGDLRAHAGRLPPGHPTPEETWNSIDLFQRAFQRTTCRGYSIVALPILDVRRGDRWLAVITPEDTGSATLVRPVVETAERLLEVISLAREAAAAEDRLLKAELLSAVLQGVTGHERAMLEARLAALGVDLATPARVVIIVPTSGVHKGRSALTLSTTRALLEEILAAKRIPYLLAERDVRLIAFIQDPCDEIERWLTHISRDNISFGAGLGRKVTSIEDLRESLLDAELAVTQLEHERGTRAALFFEDFDLASWLISTAMSTRLSGKVENMLAPIKSNDLCWQALVAYFDAHLDVNRAAQTLHLHPNSVRYRLSKASALLGQPLNTPSTLVNLYLAIAIDRTGHQTDIDGRTKPARSAS